MALLIFLPLLLAHPPINVQPRSSLLRRMPMLFGKRDHSSFNPQVLTAAGTVHGGFAYKRANPLGLSASSSPTSPSSSFAPSYVALVPSDSFAIFNPYVHATTDTVYSYGGHMRKGLKQLTRGEIDGINAARYRLGLARAASQAAEGRPSSLRDRSSITLRLYADSPDFLKAVTEDRNTYNAADNNPFFNSRNEISSLPNPYTYKGIDNSISRKARRRLRLQLLAALVSDAARSPNDKKGGLGFEDRMRALNIDSDGYSTEP